MCDRSVYQGIGDRSTLNAFTRRDVIIVIFVCVLLCGLAWPFINRTRRVRAYVDCSANLKFIGFGVREFANDHGDLAPWNISTNQGGTLEFGILGEQTFRHFQVLSNYINQWHFLICPQDTRKIANNWEDLGNTNISYRSEERRVGKECR